MKFPARSFTRAVTTCAPDYDRDESFQKEYAATAKDPEAWEAFKARYLDVPEEEYEVVYENGVRKTIPA